MHVFQWFCDISNMPIFHKVKIQTIILQWSDSTLPFLVLSIDHLFCLNLYRPDLYLWKYVYTLCAFSHRVLVPALTNYSSHQPAWGFKIDAKLTASWGVQRELEMPQHFCYCPLRCGCRFHKKTNSQSKIFCRRKRVNSWWTSTALSSMSA